MLNIQDIFPTNATAMGQLKDNVAFDIKVAFPAIVNKVNADGTVDIQPAIRDRVKNLNNQFEYIQLPVIPNVPVCFPSGGGYSISMPVAIGDECLAVICDSSFDYWWLYGGIQNPVEIRRHDLTDAIAIMGIKNNTKATSFPSGLTIKGPSIQLALSNGRIDVTGSLYVNGKEVLVDEDS